jgi:hypothetical protein
LAGGFRLRNECFTTWFAFSVLFELFAEVSIFSRQQPGLGIELVLFGEPFLHSVQVSGQMVFSGQRIHAGKVVNALVRFHLVEPVHSNSIVCPKNVPLVLLVIAVFVTLAVG